jgi:hypothetical protein
MLGDDPFDIEHRSRTVEDARLPFVHQVMRLAVEREFVHRGIAKQNRRIGGSDRSSWRQSDAAARLPA